MYSTVCLFFLREKKTSFENSIFAEVFFLKFFLKKTHDNLTWSWSRDELSSVLQLFVEPSPALTLSWSQIVSWQAYYPLEQIYSEAGSEPTQSSTGLEYILFTFVHLFCAFLHILYIYEHFKTFMIIFVHFCTLKM